MQSASRPRIARALLCASIAVCEVACQHPGTPATAPARQGDPDTSPGGQAGGPGRGAGGAGGASTAAGGRGDGGTPAVPRRDDAGVTSAGAGGPDGGATTPPPSPGPGTGMQPPPIRTPNELTTWSLQDAAMVTGAGDVVSRAGFDTSGWYPAVVPGTVLTTLVKAKVFPEPTFGKDNESIPDLAGQHRKYWYRTQFTLPAGFAGKRVWLQFKGISYRADIWVDGAKLGSMAGAFKRGFFDATAQLTGNGPHALAVLVYPNDHPGTPTDDIKTYCGQRDDDRLGFDGPTFTVVLGNHWTRRVADRNIGLWQGVFLGATGPVAIRDPLVVTDLPLPDVSRATLTVGAQLVNATAAPVTGVLRGTIENVTFQQPISLAAGETKDVTFRPADFPQLQIANPRLWWPNLYGKQDLYRCDLTFQLADQSVSDQQSVNFGVRKLTYGKGGPSDEIRVNGKKIFVRGGNMGLDEIMKRVSPKKFETWIRFHRDANLVMIRNYAGNSGNDDFYDLADRYGILLWEENFLDTNDCSAPSADKVPLHLANVEDRVRRYRSHPSIALWVGMNEGNPPKALDDGFREIYGRLDPTRAYVSASFGSGGPYAYVEPSTYGGGNFRSEIGLTSVPTAETMRAMMPAASVWPPDRDMWLYHNFGGYGDNGGYDKAIAAKYGAPTGIDDYCKKAQAINFVNTRAIYEGYAGAPGVLNWCTHPSWPTTVWQIYDYFGEPTAGFFGTRKACEPLHVYADMKDGWKVKVFNIAAQPAPNLAVKATVYDLKGAAVGPGATATITAAPEVATAVFDAPWPADLAQHPDRTYLMRLVATGASGAVVSENFYWHSAGDASFKELGTLPPVSLTGAGTVAAAGTLQRMTATVSNPGAAPAFMVRLKLTQGNDGPRVLPVFYDDNYFTLLPGERKTVTADFYPEDAGGSTPTLQLGGYNVQPGTVALTPAK